MYIFYNVNLNKFVMLLRKGVYPYEYMDSWEKFNETSLTAKKDLYSELTLEDISEKDYEHAQKVFKEYSTDMGNYHDLYVQTDTLLLADVLKNLEKNALKYMDLIVLDTWLAWQAYLKKTQLKLELLTDINMLLMLEKGIRGGMCQSTHKYMKNYDKKLSHYI